MYKLPGNAAGFLALLESGGEKMEKKRGGKRKKEGKKRGKKQQKWRIWEGMG